jgi:hypothetical protein
LFLATGCPDEEDEPTPEPPRPGSGAGTCNHEDPDENPPGCGLSGIFLGMSVDEEQVGGVEDLVGPP